MVEAGGAGEGELPAGDFSSWLAGMQGAIREGAGSDVPCGSCTACCTSSQFVHIGPDETDTLSHVPAALLFPAPRLPRGNVVMGYDERGHCPMLVDDRCSIYEHRPRTCRTYDCRVFPATGLGIDDLDRALIARQVRRWRFGLPTEADGSRRDALRAAAAFLQAHRTSLPEGAVPANVTQLAVLAIEIHEAFLRPDDETGQPSVFEPDPEVVRAAIMRGTEGPGPRPAPPTPPRRRAGPAPAGGDPGTRP